MASNKNSIAYLVRCIKDCDSIQGCMEKVRQINNKKQDSIDGFIFEKLFDLCFKFGLVKGVTNKEFSHIAGNVSLKRGREIKSLQAYIQETKIDNSCGTGFSDITMKRKANGAMIFVQSKYFTSTKDVTKNMNDYDIGNVVAREGYDESRGDELWLCVHNKRTFEDKVCKGDRELKDRVSRVLDSGDLEKMYPELRSLLTNIENYDDLLVKNKMKLLFHQRGIVNGVIKAFENGSKQVLIGAKPRAGKTYICGGLISALRPINALIITPAPSETKQQFIGDMFESHVDFNTYTITDLNGSNMSYAENKFGSKNIVVVSKQFLQNKSNAKTLEALADLRPELVFFDENHEGGCTDLSKRIMEAYTKDSCKVFMTATYVKPLGTWGIEENECFYWSMEDVAKAQNLKNNLSYFEDKFGKSCLEGYHIDDVIAYYKTEPELCLMTTMFQKDYYADLQNEIGKDDLDGFSMEGLFEMNSTKTDFINPAAMSAFMKKIGGVSKVKQDKDCMLYRVNKVMELKGHKRTDNFYTQLWFLPYGQGRPIDKISQVLKAKYLAKHPILCDYATLVINSKHSDVDAKNLKNQIDESATTARKAGKKGLIILVGNKCALGISIKSCDVVMLFNTLTSSDKIMQMLYRCMTEDYSDGKRVGVVVDMDMFRVLNTLTYYGNNSSIKDENAEARLRYVAENLVNIDYDQVFENKKVNTEKLIKRLLEIWQLYHTSSYANLLKSIANCDIDVDREDQRMLNALGRVSGHLSTAEKHELSMGDSDQEVNSGVAVEYEERSQEAKQEEEKEEKGKVTLSKDVLVYVVPFVAFMTMNTDDTDLHEMLRFMGSHENLRNMFDEQCAVWWDKAGNYLEKIEYLVTKHIKKNSDIFNIAMLLKSQIKGLIHDKEKVVQYIVDNLKPKEEEKKKLGAVYTPPSLINDMLDKLPVEVWTNPDLKWLDPAAGIGNFQVFVFQRLMVGLSGVIECEEERKKHILENMIYTCEIDPKSVHIYKQVFDGERYALNVHEGDFLKMDPEKAFGVKMFDVVIGNPPYQPPSNNKKGGVSLWPLFVTLGLDMLKKNGYIGYIHPALWRKPDNKMREVMFAKQFLHLQICSDAKGKKTFGATTRYDWYIMENTHVYKDATVVFEDDSVCRMHISLDLAFIPNFGGGIFGKVMNKSIGHKTLVVKADSMCHTSRKYVVEVKDDDHPHVQLNSVSRTNGKTYRYSSIAHPDQTQKKVMFSNGRFVVPFYDDGVMGVTQGGLYIPVGTRNEGDKVVAFLNSKLVKYMLKATKWSNFETSKQIFRSIPHPENIPTIDDATIYAHFGLSDDEILNVERLIKS